MELEKHTWETSRARLQKVSPEFASVIDRISPADDHAYNGTMPVGIIVKNSIESFLATHDKVIPATLYDQGKMITLWRLLDEGSSYQEGNFWNVSSGAEQYVCCLK